MVKIFSQLSICIALAVACTADKPQTVSADDCKRVRAHSAALRIASVQANSKLSEKELAQHENIFAKSSEAYLDHCVENRNKTWVTCMLALESLDNEHHCE